MEKNYDYEWLEQLITIDLNPELSKPTDLDNEAMQDFLSRLKEEKLKICFHLKQQMFNSVDEQQSTLLVQKHHAAVIFLIDKTFQLSVKPEIKGTHAEEVLAYASIVLEEIQQFIEVNYYMFLSAEARVPLPELLELKENITLKLEILPEILREGRNSEKVIDIAMDAYYEFISRIERKELITVREATYHRELLKDLETGNMASNVLPDCPTLHELLFSWNFNSKKMISYFTSGLEGFVSEREQISQKLEFLHYHFKQLLHLPVKPSVIYNKQFPSIKSHFTSWIQREIEYWETRKAEFTPLTVTPPKNKLKAADEKVQLNLSSDQSGLIIRGAFELDYIDARSLSAAFKKIVPDLSTMGADDPDWDNMRSSTYKAEKKDRKIASGALRRIADWIDAG